MAWQDSKMKPDQILMQRRQEIGVEAKVNRY